MKKIFGSSNFIPILVILIFCLYGLFDFFHAGILLTHDGRDHVARIANFYTSLSEGIFIPRWAGNLNWGFGHPILMFLYPLPSYFASAFHFLGFNLSQSFNLVFATSYLASGIGMYFWLRTFVAKYPSLLGAVLYLFLPYRFIDIYVRGAVGEHVAFIFPPLIFLFLTRITRGKNIFNSIGLAFSFAGLMLSHNAISIMFLPIFMGFMVLQFYSHKKIKIVTDQILSIVFGFCLSAFFWIPAFLEGKYTLRDVVTGKGEYASRFISVKSLLYGDWNYGISGQFTTQLGLIGIVWVLIGLYFLFRKKSAVGKKYIIFWYGVLLSSIFLTLPLSQFVYQTITTLQKFQFPWRFLSVSVFSISVLSAIALSNFKISAQKILIIVSLILLGLLSSKYVKAKGYLEKTDEFYTNIYEGTTDTGESAPIWSVRFMEKRAKSSMEVISGSANVTPIERKSTYHSYDIAGKNGVRVVENTLFFPGWQAYVDGDEVPIEFQDINHRGLITFSVPDGKNRIEVIFKDTKKRIIGNLISVIAVFAIVLFLLGKFLIKKYDKKK